MYRGELYIACNVFIKKYLSVVPLLLPGAWYKVSREKEYLATARFMLSVSLGEELGNLMDNCTAEAFSRKLVQCNGRYSACTSWFPPAHGSSLSLLCFCVLADLAISGEDKVATHSVCGLVKEHHYYPGVTQIYVLVEVNGCSFCVTQEQYNSRGFSKPWGLDPCSFTDSLNCSHEVCSPRASIALACCKGQKRLIQRKQSVCKQLTTLASLLLLGQSFVSLPVLSDTQIWRILFSSLMMIKA